MHHNKHTKTPLLCSQNTNTASSSVMQHSQTIAPVTQTQSTNVDDINAIKIVSYENKNIDIYKYLYT